MANVPAYPWLAVVKAALDWGANVVAESRVCELGPLNFEIDEKPCHCIPDGGRAISTRHTDHTDHLDDFRLIFSPRRPRLPNSATGFWFPHALSLLSSLVDSTQALLSQETEYAKYYTGMTTLCKSELCMEYGKRM